MKTSTYQSPFSIFLSLLFTIIVWITFAPTQLGGTVTYVIVDGNSMEPKFHLGDLVLVRKQAEYQVGDAVTYQNAEMGRYVFHRIVNIQADHFILQGDHNTWLDNYHPGQNEIIGKLWIHIPAIGKVIQGLRTPLGFALLCGVFGGVMMTGLLLKPSKQNGRKKYFTGGVGGAIEGALYLTGFVGVAFLGLTFFSFTRSLTRPAETLQYQQQSQFMYSAAGTQGVYDSATIQPGEPIFPKLTCFLNIGLIYALTGDELQAASGNYQLYARVLDEKSGWQRTFPLNTETAFNGNSYVAQSGLDLCQVETLVSSVEEQTGLHPGFYTLEVVEHTSVAGLLAGQPISDALDSILKFQFDKVNFHLAADSNESDPLHIAQSGSVKSSGSVPNTLTILGNIISVRAARAWSVTGLTFSLAALLLAGWYFLQQTQSNPAELIRLKYRRLLLDVNSFQLQPNLPITDVASVDDLARLAERQNTLITHLVSNGVHYYYVQSNGMIYRHVPSSGQNNVADMTQTQPRIYLPEKIKSNYMEAIPVDNLKYSYQVDLKPIQHTRIDEDETMMLHRIKL